MANSIFLGRLNAEQRKALIERLWHAQGGKCFITGKEIDLSLHEGELDIDHVIPLTNGGKDDESNFALTFSSANRSNGGRSKDFSQIAGVKDSYVFADDWDMPDDAKLPLWMLGFLY